MVRALLWKELRQHRAVLVAGLSLVLFTPVFFALVNREGFTLEDNVRVTLFAFLAIIWPVLAAAAGSATVASERETETLRFLLSRPMSRARAWDTKVVAAASVVGVVAFSSLLLVLLLEEMIPAHDRRFLWAFDLPISRLSFLGFVSFSALLFACAVLCSTVLSRPLTAALGAFALALLVNVVVATFASASGWADGSISGALLALAGALLFLSRQIFVNYRRP